MKKSSKSTSKTVTSVQSGQRAKWLVVVLLILGVAALILTRQQKITSGVLPTITVAKWQNTIPTAPFDPKKAGVYSFDQVDPSMQAKKLSSTLLGKTDLIHKGDNYIGYIAAGTSENRDISAFTYNSAAGVFTYSSTYGRKLPAGSNVSLQANEFMQTLISDSTLKPTATYRRKDKPGVTYVEFHRDWGLVGLPIINNLGLLNLSENEHLSSLSLTGRDGKRPDTTYYETSDGTDGLTRATDFNSATLGVQDNLGSVVSVESNLRSLKSGSPKTVELMSYKDATSKLTDNKYDFMLTSPRGEGVAAVDKVYPESKGHADQATITEVRLAYVEEMPGAVQSMLEPYYVYRGTTKLDSGYIVNFVAGVKAVKSSVIDNLLSFSDADKVMAQGSVIGGNTTTPPPPPPPPGPPPPPPPPPVVDICIPSRNELNNIRSVTSISSIGQLTQAGYDRLREDGKRHGEAFQVGDWYIFSNGGFITAAEVTAALKAIPSSEWPPRNDRADRALEELAAEPNCPARITGGSPTLFIYGPSGFKANIVSGSKVTYADPGLAENRWSAAIGPKGLSVNDVLRPYIYYEYQPVSFDRPSRGWTVDSDKLPAFARNLSRQLNFNDLEAERLLFELRFAASSVSHDKLFVGQIPRSEIDQKLPLQFSINMAVTRMHFYVGVPGEAVTTAPVLSPIARHSTMAIELGAASVR